MAAVASVDAVGTLTEMLRMDSVSGNEQALASWLAEVLDGAGFDVTLDAAGNVIATCGTGPVRTALVGHLDTAPGHIEVRRDGDLLYGRGSVDAKGPLLAALLAVMRQPRHSGRSFTVIGAVEEETTSRGAHHLTATFARPDELIILEPSGWDAITVGYKGSLRLRWSHEQESGHGAGRTVSAADRAFEFVRAVQDSARAFSHGLGVFASLDVRVLACEAGSDGLVERARVDLGLRLPPGCDADWLLETLRAAARGGQLSIEHVDVPVRASRTSVLARRFARAIRRHGATPRYKLKTGTSDLNVLVPAWGCPAVAYGPGDSNLDHTAHEHLDVREFQRAVDVLDQALVGS
jgi:LysW-gamma-L-lysine carboxypeptidase